MIPPWFSEICLRVMGNSLPLLPGFVCCFVGVACLFCPADDVSCDEGRVMLFFMATRMVGICLVLLGASALWQALW
jgi:hypothetical protein